MTLPELIEVNEWRWPDVVFGKPALDTLESAYSASDETGSISAYCHFGSASRVGLDPAVFVAVSAGLKPDLVDGGNGPQLMSAVLALGRQKFPEQTVVGVIKDSNQRSLKSALSAGFAIMRRHDDEGVIVVDGESVDLAEASQRADQR